jgi:glutathione synthase/RimK-type ligase-like ATP-grasp enzyme
VAPWDALAPDPAAPVCLRSTWDYFRRWPEFRRWIAGFASGPGLLWNPPSTVLWNADKTYLRELAEAGVRVPSTRWFEPGERPDTARFFRETGAPRAVLKPRISGGARGTHLLEPASRLEEATLAPSAGVGSLLQAFVPEIADGEASLIFVDGRFSHAVHKLPATGDFRVQRHFGGRAEPLAPDVPLRGFADRVLAAVAHPWVYARVDIVRAPEGPALMELELIEPDLYLAHAPAAAAGALADALIRQAMAG